MIECIQETDSKIIFPYPIFWESLIDMSTNSGTYSPIGEYKTDDQHELYLTVREPTNQTIGGNIHQNILQIPQVSNIIQSAWSEINKNKNPALVNQARDLLLNIQELVVTFELFDFDLDFLSPINAFNIEEDNSILIEWIFNDYRVGFNIETKNEESGWYLVTNRELGEISASGSIHNIEIKTILLWLLNFVISNS